MKLAQAQQLASKILASMQSYVVRAAVAGSIRRRKEEVKDIEIVAIPRLGDKTDLFDESRSNYLYDWARKVQRERRVMWIKPGTHEIIPWHLEEQGKYWRGLLSKTQIKLDLFLTTEDAWGCTFLLRTGPADYSAHIVSQCRPAYYFSEGKLFNQTGNAIATPEEQDVYNALGLAFVAPEERQ